MCALHFLLISIANFIPELNINDQKPINIATFYNIETSGKTHLNLIKSQINWKNKQC